MAILLFEWCVIADRASSFDAAGDPDCSSFREQCFSQTGLAAARLPDERDGPDIPDRIGHESYPPRFPDSIAKGIVNGRPSVMTQAGYLRVNTCTLFRYLT